MSGEDILALVIIGILAIIILVAVIIFLYKECQNLHIENKMLRKTIDGQARLDELSFAAYQAMLDEAKRNLPPY